MARATTQPKPITIKRPTIDLAGLELAYGWMAYEKLTGLQMAADWYSTNAPYLLAGQPLTADQNKTYDRAGKLSNQGHDASGTTPEERESFLLMAIRLYEKIWSTTTRFPIGSVITSSNATAVKTVVDNFNAAFSRFHVQYAPTTMEEREFNDQPQLVSKAEDPAGTMNTINTYAVRVPFKELLDLAGKSPLESALLEAPAVTQMISITTRLEQDPTTGLLNKVAELDGSKFMENLPVVLSAVYAFAAGDAKLAQPVGKVAKSAVIKGSAVTRTKKWSDSDIIHILKSSHPFTGVLGQKVDLIRDGMTVGEFKRARRQAGLGSGCYPLETSVKRGYIRVG